MRLLHFLQLLGVALLTPNAVDAGHEKTLSKSVPAAAAYFKHNTGLRTDTDSVIYEALRQEYPESQITIVPTQSCDLFSYAAAGHATTTLLADDSPITSHSWRMYIAPARRLDGENGTLVDIIKFGIYQYSWENNDFLVFRIEGRDGMEPYPAVINQYIIGPKSAVDELITVIGKYNTVLHEEIWVFDQGYWQKDAGMWKAIQKSYWSDVILDPGMKKELMENVNRFFDSRHQYQRLGVPWKRGIIYHGPPGNGKTISIKATMHMLYNRTEPIPTLYVKSLKTFSGAEWGLNLIFQKARQQAPCHLVFEDLDSLVTDDVRSYFLNQVDGVQSNDGILMVGSTNHLERLDPGIAKRPSRFDRKFYFPDPSFDERVQYCEYWRKKLDGKDALEFPKELTKAVANITDGFSFAYIQEAFVASLLLIAGQEEDGKIHRLERNAPLSAQVLGGKDLENVLLWQVIREQIKILRDELEATQDLPAESPKASGGLLKEKYFDEPRRFVGEMIAQEFGLRS